MRPYCKVLPLFQLTEIFLIVLVHDDNPAAVNIRSTLTQTLKPFFLVAVVT